MTSKDLRAARGIAERAGANRQTLVAFDEEISRAEEREQNEYAAKTLEDLAASIRRGDRRVVTAHWHRPGVEVAFSAATDDGIRRFEPSPNTTLTICFQEKKA